MPVVMSLEGLRAPSMFDRFRRRLRDPDYGMRGLGATPTPPIPPAPVGPPSQVSLFFGAIKAHPIVLVLGVFGGMWLAGSKSGQQLFRKKS